MIAVTPTPTRCKGWDHRNCAGHYGQPQPDEIIHLDGPNYTRVSEEPGYFLMGYVGGDGRLTEVLDTQGEAFIVRYLREAAVNTLDYPARSCEWEAVTLYKGGQSS